MVRSIWLLAAAALAAGLAAATPVAHAQNAGRGRCADNGTSGVDAPEGEAASDSAEEARKANESAPAGRQITVHARPSYLTLGTQAPVGTVGNGYVYSTFNQPTPIEGTFMGMRGRERITDPLGNASPGLTLFRF